MTGERGRGDKRTSNEDEEEMTKSKRGEREDRRKGWRREKR